MKRTVSFLFALALACSGAQNGPKNKISPDAVNTDAFANVQVIVQWTVATGPITTAKILALGGRVVKQFTAIHQGVYVIPGSALSSLDADPTVKYVSIDRTVKRKLATTAAAINAPTVWKSGYVGTGIGVAVLDSGINPDPNLGLKTPIAGLLAVLLPAAPVNQPVYTDDFTPSAYDSNNHPTPSFGQDWYGHGQHIAGIIASNGQASTCPTCSAPLVGIAPGANLIDLKVLDSTGEGTDSQVIAAIDQAITLKNTYNIRVMNLSLGRPVYESYTQDPLCQAVEAAWQAGIVVVVAAGNDGRDNSNNNLGYGTILAPGNDPYVITVGSMKTMGTAARADDLIASYSSKGPTAVDEIVKPDIVAPGNLIVSLLAQHGTLPLTNPQNAVTSYSIQGAGPQPNQAPAGGNVPANTSQQPPAVNFGPGYSNSYYTLSGTSMATAVVSGAVADLLQAHPKLTPDQVKILLMQSASKTFPQSSTVVDNTGDVYTAYYDIFTVGAGYLDMEAAMNQAAQVPTSGDSLSPASSYDPTSGNIYLTFDTNSAWVNQSVWPNTSYWGPSAVWSSSVLNGSQAIWSSKSMWGASADSAASNLYSEKSMWGASSDATESTDASESIINGDN